MNGTKILIVEDEFVVANDLETCLLDLGYEVTGKVDSGAAAIELADSQTPDLVLMDIRLQGPMDGITAATEIRRRFKLPVIFLTAYADDSTLERAKMAEPFGYILKPFDDRELHTNIEIAVFKHKAEREIRRLNRLYATLSQVNQAIMRLRSPAELLAKICDVALEFGRFQTAWIGQLDAATGAVEVIVKTGDHPGVAVGASVQHCGCALEAVRREQPYKINELRSDPSVRCQGLPGKIGLRSCAAFPIRFQNRLWGVFVVGSGESNFFNDAESRLLEEVALDISFAMDTFESERQRRRTKEALKEREQHLETILRTALDGFWIVGAAGEFLEVNDAYCVMSGYPRRELLKMRITDIESAETARETADHIRRIKREGRDRFETRHRRKDGKVIDVEVSVTFQNFNDGQFVCFLRNITERKQLEARLRHSQRMEVAGQLAGGVAHDFNNLLGVILGNLELLSERIPPDEISHRYLERVQSSAHSATAVTRQLLAFSRKQILQPVVLNLNLAIQQLNKMTQRVIGENIQVALNLEPNLGYVEADPGQIEQVLMNLMVNARDAMPHGGKLSIKTVNVCLNQEFVESHLGSKVGEFIKLSVTDNGSGMDKGVMEHMFEPFFTTKEVGKGTGLGLATVYGIVKQSEGYICVESEPGMGTTFEIYLPRVNGELAVARSLESAGSAWGSETILLVEDDQLLREVTLTQLEKLGYQVYEAGDANQAFILFDEHAKEISLLLTDVIMPGLNGRVLANKLREKKPDLRILFMSGYTDDEILREGVSESNQAIVIKPFTHETLAFRIREILDGTPHPPVE